MLGYLERAACATQTRDDIVTFQEAVKHFKLTRMETLAIVNTPPSSVVEVHLLVEECEERLQPADVKALLALCRQHLTPPDDDDGGVMPEPPMSDDAVGDADGSERMDAE